MPRQTINSRPSPSGAPGTLRKKATGIAGFDQITGGGLPEGRMPAVVGGPGTGKSLFGAQYLHHRYVSDGEPGSFMGFDARLDRNVELAGDFDLTGLLATLSARIRTSGARHVMFDGIDTLIDALADYRPERREITRIDDWARDERLTGRREGDDLSERRRHKRVAGS